MNLCVVIGPLLLVFAHARSEISELDDKSVVSQAIVVRQVRVHETQLVVQMPEGIQQMQRNDPQFRRHEASGFSDVAQTASVKFENDMDAVFDDEPSKIWTMFGWPTQRSCT